MTSRGYALIGWCALLASPCMAQSSDPFRSVPPPAPTKPVARPSPSSPTPGAETSPQPVLSTPTPGTAGAPASPPAAPSAAPTGAAPSQLAPGWQRVDCGSAKLTAPNQTSCLVGPPQAADSRGDRCAFEQWEVSTRSSAGVGLGYLYLKGGEPICHVVGVDPTVLLKRGPRPSIGTGWSEVVQNGDFYYANFTSAGENCKAFGKFQLPYYHLRGWLCANQGKSISDADVRAFATSLIVRVQ
jgi:hypothetical protein